MILLSLLVDKRRTFGRYLFSQGQREGGHPDSLILDPPLLSTLYLLPTRDLLSAPYSQEGCQGLTWELGKYDLSIC